MRNTKITPLYERLSCDDELQGESNSISNPYHFTDDGISGIRFDRPGFTAMMQEVEAGRDKCRMATYGQMKSVNT